LELPAIIAALLVGIKFLQQQQQRHRAVVFRLEPLLLRNSSHHHPYLTLSLAPLFGSSTGGFGGFGAAPASQKDTAGGGGFSFESTTASAALISTNSGNSSIAAGASASGFSFGGAQALLADSSKLTLGGFGGLGNTAATSIPQSNSVTGSFGSNDDSKPAAKATSTAFAGFGSPSATLTAPVQATPPIPGDSTQNESKPAGTGTAFPSFGGFGSSTAPNAATSFSFGGASATTEATKMATTTPAGGTTGGAFSFNSGGVAAAAAAAPATPQPPSTPGPPAPVATPAKDISTPGGPVPAATTPAAAAAASSSSSATANPPPPAATSTEPVRLEYQTMTVEQIINAFQQEMEKDAKIYLKEARRVAEYDAILRDSQRDLNVLTEQTRRCLIEQKEVEQTLNGIGAMQDEVGRLLETVELNVDELFASTQSFLMPADADFEREMASKMAHDVDIRLQTLHFALEDKIIKMDKTQEQAMSGLGDVAKIVQVLNQHQNSLAALEDAGQCMEHDIVQVNRVLLQDKP
jgi:nuclear pore complex protein Nup62